MATSSRKKKSTTSAKKSAPHNGKTRTNVTATTTTRIGAPLSYGSKLLTVSQDQYDAIDRLLKAGGLTNEQELSVRDRPLINAVRKAHPETFVSFKEAKQGRGMTTTAARLAFDLSRFQVGAKRAYTRSGGGGTKPPERDSGLLTLENLIAFTDALSDKVEAQEAAVKAELQGALKEAQDTFNNNLAMGVGTDTLKKNMEAVIEAKKRIDDSSQSVLRAALKELDKEDKYPRELLRVMQGKP